MSPESAPQPETNRGFLFWFCVLYNVALVACVLLADTFSLQVIVFLLGMGWTGLSFSSLIVWSFYYREPKRRAWEPFTVCCVALLLMFLSLSVSEHIAWALKRSTMQRAAQRIAREHPQDGDAPLRADERWILSSTEEGSVDVRRYGRNWTVLFVTGDTLFSGATGYLYSSLDKSPGEELDGGGYLEALERRAPHWFYCYSPNGWD